jgi:3'-phosphoadenosine 5'-phosphosulfate sulfotransferase (PAPS reductase)/FAD synthetase
MIATGAKKADSMFRRKSWQQFEKDYLLYPLKDWGTRDVLGYLSIRGLPTPSLNEGFQTSGVDLTTRDVLRIHDAFPGDFEKIEKVFPYVRAVVKRRDWYGVTK